MPAADWVVMGVYALAVVAIGVSAGRGSRTREDYFLGGRRMPVWAVLFSMVATELSAATFIGVPKQGYAGDWFYLQFAIGSLAARVVLAVWFIRLYHRMGLVTVYGLLEDRFGPRSRTLSAWCFLCGRILASGTRLFIAGLAFATVLRLSVETAIIVAGSLAAAYTIVGGIRAVIWTDTLQGVVFVVAAVSALWVASDSAGGLSVLFEAAHDAGKTRVFHLPGLLGSGTDPDSVWEWLGRAWDGFREVYLGKGNALVTAVIGGFFLTLATHGTDQDMVQRLLTTSDGRKGGRALVLSGIANFPLTLLFLAVGTGLWFFYQKTTVSYATQPPERIFPIFMVHELPVGVRGFVFAGLFAAAMSSMDSALNALVTTWTVDIRRRDPGDGLGRVKRATVVFAVLLIGAALLAVELQKSKASGDADLVSLALGVMAIFYGGLLGTFLLAIFSRRRGNDRTAVLGLLVGAATGILLATQTYYLGGHVAIAFPWWTLIGAMVALAVGALGRRSGNGSAMDANEVHA